MEFNNSHTGEGLESESNAERGVICYKTKMT